MMGIYPDYEDLVDDDRVPGYQWDATEHLLGVSYRQMAESLARDVRCGMDRTEWEALEPAYRERLLVAGQAARKRHEDAVLGRGRHD